MKFLLDVNSLIALGFGHHLFHPRMATWVQSNPDIVLCTCSIVELGFVRVLAQATPYGFSVSQARSLLEQLKSSKFRIVSFLPDDQDISHLPIWVKSPGQTTDGHLVELAKAHGCKLATFDTGIPGAFAIP